MSSSLLNDDPSLVDLLPPEPSNASRLMLATRYSKTLLEANRSLAEEVERLKDENLQLKRDLEAQVLNSHTELQCHKKTCEEHVGELYVDLQCLAQREKASEATVTKLRKANENLSAELEDLRAAIKKYAQDYNVHQKECSEIRKQARENEQALREELVLYKKENESLQQSLQDTQKKCNCKETQNKKLEERVSELQRCYKGVVDELERSRSSCEDREEKCAELSEKLKELEDVAFAAHVTERIRSEVCSPSHSISLYEELSNVSQDPFASTRNGSPEICLCEEYVLDPVECQDCCRLKEENSQLEKLLLRCVEQKIRLHEDLCRWEDDMFIVVEKKVQNFFLSV
ncbi:hypothetical protein EMCRGX_G024729 [Ephydatia muelleri]